MMFPSNRVRIVIATKPVDFRKGHDGLAAPPSQDGSARQPMNSVLSSMR